MIDTYVIAGARYIHAYWNVIAINGSILDARSLEKIKYMKATRGVEVQWQKSVQSAQVSSTHFEKEWSLLRQCYEMAARQAYYRWMVRLRTDVAVWRRFDFLRFGVEMDHATMSAQGNNTDWLAVTTRPVGQWCEACEKPRRIMDAKNLFSDHIAVGTTAAMEIYSRRPLPIQNIPLASDTYVTFWLRRNMALMQPSFANKNFSVYSGQISGGSPRSPYYSSVDSSNKKSKKLHFGTACLAPEPIPILPERLETRYAEIQLNLCRDESMQEHIGRIILFNACGFGISRYSARAQWYSRLARQGNSGCPASIIRRNTTTCELAISVAPVGVLSTRPVACEAFCLPESTRLPPLPSGLLDHVLSSRIKLREECQLRIGFDNKFSKSLMTGLQKKDASVNSISSSFPTSSSTRRICGD